LFEAKTTPPASSPSRLDAGLEVPNVALNYG